MNKTKLISALLVMFITAPIWFYLLHWVLTKTGAGELQFFLFWIYVPVGILGHILGAIAAANDE